MKCAAGSVAEHFGKPPNAQASSPPPSAVTLGNSGVYCPLFAHNMPDSFSVHHLGHKSRASSHILKQLSVRRPKNWYYYQVIVRISVPVCQMP